MFELCPDFLINRQSPNRKSRIDNLPVSSFDLAQSLARERVVWIQLQGRSEFPSRQVARPFSQQYRAEIRVRVGVVRIDSDKTLELERCLAQPALTRECHAEVVQRVPVIRIAIERPLVFGDRLPQPAGAIQDEPKVVARIGVVEPCERAAQNGFGLRES